MNHVPLNHVPHLTHQNLWKRRWNTFKRRPMGMIALVMLLMIIVIASLAHVLAGTNPLLVVYKDNLYFPVVESVPETTYGGFFTTQAQYTDPEVQALINADGFIVWPLIPYSPNDPVSDLTQPAPTPPDLNHWLGTDSFGRDILSRLLHSIQISLFFSLLGASAIAVIGIAIGLIQGYLGGWVDLIGQRMIEVWSSIPSFYILIIIASAISVNFLILLAIIIAFSWTSMVGFVRAETLRTRKQAYVLGAVSLGVPTWLIIIRHILPNALTATITMLPFLPLGVMATIASLDFLGFGLPTSTPSIGEMARLGKENQQAPWIAFSAFGALFVIFTLFTLLGQALREAIDHRAT